MSYTRTFRVVRVHEGEATVMAEGTGTSLEISSDKFSSYFLVYKDTKIEEATNTSTDTSDISTNTGVPKTGEYMSVAALIMLLLSMVGMVIVCVNLKNKIRL